MTDLVKRDGLIMFLITVGIRLSLVWLDQFLKINSLILVISGRWVSQTAIHLVEVLSRLLKGRFLYNDHCWT